MRQTCKYRTKDTLFNSFQGNSIYILHCFQYFKNSLLLPLTFRIPVALLKQSRCRILIISLINPELFALQYYFDTVTQIRFSSCYITYQTKNYPCHLMLVQSQFRICYCQGIPAQLLSVFNLTLSSKSWIFYISGIIISKILVP